MLNSELYFLKKEIVKLSEQIAIIEVKNKEIIIKIKDNIKEKTTNLGTKILTELDIYQKNEEELLNLNLDMFDKKIKYNDILYQQLTAKCQKSVTKVDNLNPFFADNDDNEIKIIQYLREQKNALDKEIVDSKKENEQINKKVQMNKESIINLIKQKTEKNWQITCLNIITFGIFRYCRNKKIAKKIELSKSVIEDLKKEKTTNIENIQRVKNEKLNILKKITNLQDTLLTEHILNIEEFGENNPFYNNGVIKRQNSEDSGNFSENKESNNSINIFSSIAKNDKKDTLLRSVSLPIISII